MSKANTLFVRDIILKEPALFDLLFKMVIRDSEPLSRRAIWIMDHLLEAKPELLNDNHIKQLIDNLLNYSHEGMLRHSLRILAHFEIPESHEGKLLNTCFNLLQNPKTSIASKAWCMDILYTFSEEEPELKPELVNAIEMNLDYASAGIKNKASKILSKLRKQIS
jgi:hypothetical protein